MRSPSACALIVALGAASCTVLTDLDGLSQPAEPGPGEPDPGASASSSSASSSSSSTTSGSASGSSSGTSTSTSTSTSTTSSTGAPPSNAILTEDFAGGCGGWTVSGAGTVEAVTETHSGGPGACQLCATGAGEVFLEKTVTAPRAGKAALQLFARRPSGTTPTSATAALRSGGNSSSIGRGISADFSLVGHTGSAGMSAQSGASIVARVGMQAAQAGYCVVVDDITLTLN